MNSIRNRGVRRRDSAEGSDYTEDALHSNEEQEAELLPSIVPSVALPPIIPAASTLAVKPPVLPDFWDSFNTLYYFSVFLLIGVPIWWVTTTTTYSSLPHSEIASLSTFTQEKGLLRSHHLQNKVGRTVIFIIENQWNHTSVFQAITVVEPAQKWKTFWNLPPTTAVDIVFTLVNPSPEKLKVDWNIEEGLKSIKYFLSAGKYSFIVFVELFLQERS